MQADRKDLSQFFVQIVLFRKNRVDMTLDGLFEWVTLLHIQVVLNFNLIRKPAIHCVILFLYPVKPIGLAGLSSLYILVAT
jgi:hypothetical protein